MDDDELYVQADLRNHFHHLIDHFRNTEELQRVTGFTRHSLQAAVALINFIDNEYQTTISSSGPWEHSRLPVSQSYCYHTLRRGEFIRVDPRSEPDPELIAVTAPYPFYAGVPITNPGGDPFATLCIMHHTPLDLSESQIMTLRLLAEKLRLRFETWVLQRHQEEIEHNLQKKETLFNEIHHRIKNNLGDIIGILQIQWFETEDPTVRSILSRVEARIIAVIKLHEILYESNELVKANLRLYVERLIQTIREITGREGSGIDFHLDVAEIRLDLNQAMSLGLIIHELVTNAIHHAFSGRQEGVISVTIRPEQKDQDLIQLRIEDNGQGMKVLRGREDSTVKEPDGSGGGAGAGADAGGAGADAGGAGAGADRLDVDGGAGVSGGVSEYSNMGLKLVELLTQQLNGNIEVQSGKEGTRFLLEFSRQNRPLPRKNRRILAS